MRVRARTDRKVNYWLTPGAEYEVIGLDDRYYRVVNDGGEPTLFAHDEFEVADSTVPSDWIWRRFADGEYFADPPELASRGFWEAVNEHQRKAVDAFVRYARRRGLDLTPKKERLGKRKGVAPDLRIEKGDTPPSLTAGA